MSLKEKIADLLERQDQLTELEYLQEKQLLIDECMKCISDAVDAYELLQ